SIFHADTPDDTRCTGGKGGITLLKGVYSTLCFDELEIWQFLIPVKDNATVDALWYDYILTATMAES
ncbi:MAG: hypothetical protein K2F78_05915, partial [Muribaculaceae bacterium]|nr:hypothetical protein [Muribaculaceae bacterium]